MERKRFKFSRKLKGIPITLIVLLVATLLVSAVLLTVYTTYYVGQTQTIDLEGELPVLYIDGTGVLTESFSMATDAFSEAKLVNGETETFSHTVSVLAGNGNWEATFTVPEYTDPDHEFYGYTCTILDSGDVDITDTGLTVDAGNTETFKIKHNLHEDWLDSGNDLDFVLDILLSEILGLSLTDIELIWQMNTGSGSIAYDSGNNDYNGTITGTIWDANAKLGAYCLLFDNVADVVETATSTIADFEHTDAFSFETWINTSTDTVSLFDKYEQTTENIGIQILLTGGKVDIYLQDATATYDNIKADTMISTDGSTWTHVIITYDGSSDATGFSIYYDAVLQSATVNTDTFANGTVQNNDVLEVGGLGSNYKLDALVVHTKELSQDEINTQYNDGAGTEQYSS